MLRYALLLLVLAVALMAANLKLYLKDGGFQVVREYKIEGDVISYYSVERSDWEEMPVALVDLKKTEAEAAAAKSRFEKQDRQLAEEEEAARELRKEILRIPTDPGVYRLSEDKQLQVFKQADTYIHNDKGRNIWKALSPIPVIAGKSTLEIGGERGATVIREDRRPEFFMQLSLPDSIGLVRLTVRNGIRIVERITIEPITKMLTEERDSVEIFTKQLTESNLFKVWPQADLAPGEYALIEYDEGQSNLRVWDFRIE